MIGRIPLVVGFLMMFGSLGYGVAAQESSPPPTSSSAPPPPESSPPPSSSSSPTASSSDPASYSTQYTSSSAPYSSPTATYSPPPTYSQQCGPDYHWEYDHCAPNSGTAPPPSCPPGSWWDNYSHTCRSDGGSYPPPPSGSYQCPPDTYCGPPPSGSYAPPPSGGYNSYCYPKPENNYCRPPDGGSMPPPPPGCDPNGYCPPPPQNSCPPGDAYCRPPPPPECGQKMEALRSQMEGLFRDFQASMEAFHQQFETARQQFSAQPHADSEWRAFGEKWRIQGEALGQGFRQKMESFVQSNGLGSCMPYMPPPPMGGGFGGGMSGGSEPPHMEYAKAPPQGNQFYNEDQQAREIRERCEAEVRAVIGAPPAGGGATIQGDPSSGGSSQYGAPQYNSGGSAPAPQGYSSGYAPMKMDPEKEAQVREIMKRCEAEIRSHYQDFYQKEGRPEGREDEFGSFNIFMDEADHKIVVTGKYLGLSGNPDTQMMLDVTCGGQKFLDSVRAKGFLEAFDFENTGEGTKLDIKAGGRSVLQLHDNPRCAINVRAGGAVPSIALDLADYLDVEKDENGYRFSDGEIDGKVLVNSGDASLESGGVLVVTGHATFLVSSGAAGSAGSSFSGDLNIKHALEKGKVGAEVLVALNGDKIKSDATPYADMEIGVEKKGDRGISATIDSASHDGKTVVMSFDGDIFSDLELDVQVFAVEGEEETAACVREASSLQDVLEPGDDEDCQEYWAVEDKAGVHLMVSFPHFSKKRVEIQSVGTSVGGPIPGFELVVLGLAVSAALVGVGVRLRKDS